MDHYKICLICTKSVVWAHTQPGVHCDPQELFSQTGSTRLSWYTRLLCHKCQTLHFLLNFMDFMLTQPSSFPVPFWTEYLLLNKLTPAPGLLRAHSASSLSLSMNRLNCVNPIINLMVVNCHLLTEQEVIEKYLWFQQFRQVSVHLVVFYMRRLWDMAWETY